MSKRKKSPKQRKIERQYQNQVRRINEFIKAKEALGYSFPSFVMPTKPKRITEASVRKLKQYNAQYFYKTGFYVSNEGEAFEAWKAKTAERNIASIRRSGKQKKVSKEQEEIMNSIVNRQVIEHPTNNIDYGEDVTDEMEYGEEVEIDFWREVRDRIVAEFPETSGVWYRASHRKNGRVFISYNLSNKKNKLLDIWDEALAEHGAKEVNAYAAEIMEQLTSYLDQISHDSKAEYLASHISALANLLSMGRALSQGELDDIEDLTNW